MIDVLILFEHSGLAAEAFTSRGLSVAIVDIKNVKANQRSTYTLDWDVLKREADLIELASTARLVIGMPPCTDLAVSGALRFEDKAYRDPKFHEKAMHLFKAPARIADAIKRPYVIENPKSMASTFWRKPDFSVHPFEFGGYLAPDDTHPDWPEYIPPQDAYPKLTCLWTSEGFKLPPKRVVDQISVHSDAFKKLGGKSAKTKEIRSASPRGLFAALAEGLIHANH